MPRRRVPEKREILPDPKFGNVTLAKFMNHVMVSGKKAVAEKIVYGALDRVSERNGSTPNSPGLHLYRRCDSLKGRIKRLNGVATIAL